MESLLPDSPDELSKNCSSSASTSLIVGLRSAGTLSNCAAKSPVTTGRAALVSRMASMTPCGDMCKGMSDLPILSITKVPVTISVMRRPRAQASSEGS